MTRETYKGEVRASSSQRQSSLPLVALVSDW